MKKLILIASLLLLLAACAVWAGGLGSVTGSGGIPFPGQGTVAVGTAPVVYIHNLALDDDVGTAVVSNTGTGGNWATTANWTSAYHNDDAKEGTGSFQLYNSQWCIYSGANWTSEYFVLLFWWKPATTDADAVEFIFQVGNGDAAVVTNEVHLIRASGSNEFDIRGKGNDGSVGIKTSTNAPEWDVGTWYLLKLTVKADNAGWVGTTLGYNTDGSDTFTDLTFGAWDAAPNAAVFNSLVYISSNAVNTEPDARVDHVRMWSLQ